MTGRVVLLGGSGQIGRLLSAVLTERGLPVVPVSRSTGVDARTGVGVRAAVDGADTVVDCLNIETARRGPAESFFRATARHLTDAARVGSVRHLVCLSIVNATDPVVASALGYYAGKAVQERVYATSGLPVTVARTTQWFELAATMVDRFRIGRWVLVPSMLVQPVAAVAAAEFLADLVRQGPAAGAVAELAGPQVHDLADLVRRLAELQQPGTRVFSPPVLPKPLRTGALLPRRPGRIDPRTFSDWLGSGWPGSDWPGSGRLSAGP